MSRDVRTALVVRAVRSGIAADQTDFTVRELRLAAHLHWQVDELLSAEQYVEMANRKEVDFGKREGSSSIRAV